MTAERVWADRWADSRDVFDGLTGDYDRYRPRYAPASLERIRAYAGRVERLADVASGTGILTRALRAAFPDALVVGVEPGDDMLAEAARATAPERRLLWLGARAEALPFADGVLDVVTAGQAVHWFDREAFYRECRRTLRPGGTLAVLYNNRIAGSPVAEAHESTLERVSPGYWRGYRDHDTDGELRNHPATRDVEQHRDAWSWDRAPDEFIGYVRSTSHFKAALRTGPEDDVMEELRCAIAPLADDDGLLRVPYETVATLARFG